MGPSVLQHKSLFLQKRLCHSLQCAKVKVLAAQAVLSICFGGKKDQWLLFAISEGYFVADEDIQDTA